METNKIYEAAKEYIQHGISVIPVSKEKKPLVSWKTFQNRYATDDELQEWFVDTDANIAIVTGELSGLTVLDLDSDEAVGFVKEKKPGKTPLVKTARGCHLYYKYEDGHRNFQKQAGLPDIDLRGEGGYVVAPPSQHASGHTYTWWENRHLCDLDLIALPSWVLPSKDNLEPSKMSLEEIKKGVSEGSRNNALTQLAGQFISNGCDSQEAATKYCLEWNRKNSPPLPETEVRRTVRSIWETHQKNKDMQTPSKEGLNALELIMSITNDMHIFRDQHNEVFVNLDGDCVPLEGATFRKRIQYLCWANYTQKVSSETIKSATDILSAQAGFEGEQVTLYTRVGKTNDAFWYDLGRKQTVKITPDGWSLQGSPELFRRYHHQGGQVTPVAGGNPWSFLDLTNVASDQKLLTLVTIIAMFVPDIAHPIFHPHGAQGSGKSTFCKIIKKLCDPCTTELLLLPSKHDDLIHALNQHHVPIFDNVSKISQEQSNTLCTACTGGGIQKRRLYTDDELISYNIKRCIGLNGINVAFNKPDIIDRTILIGLDRISPDQRREEEELWQTFDAIKPNVLGGIFDTLSKAMAVYPSVNLTWHPRLADFARWGYAIAEALGAGLGSQFLSAYQKNIESQNNEVMHQNTLLQAVTDYMADCERWDTTIAECWSELADLTNYDPKNTYSFPKSDKQLRKKLEEIRANLLDYGIKYTISEKRVNSAYPIIFWKAE